MKYRVLERYEPKNGESYYVAEVKYFFLQPVWSPVSAAYAHWHDEFVTAKEAEEAAKNFIKSFRDRKVVDGKA